MKRKTDIQYITNRSEKELEAKATENKTNGPLRNADMVSTLRPGRDLYTRTIRLIHSKNPRDLITLSGIRHYKGSYVNMWTSTCRNLTMATREGGKSAPVSMTISAYGTKSLQNNAIISTAKYATLKTQDDAFRHLKSVAMATASDVGKTAPKDITLTGEEDIVLVTGGSGFLGQHIIHHLQERADHVKEIRVLDVRPYSNRLGHRESKPLITIEGDIRDGDTVQRAFQGVTTVLHVAGLVSYGTFPDLEGMERINVQGTQNIVDCCVRSEVERLIFCSTVDVVVGFDSIRGGSETTTSVPDHFLFPGYPDTKYRAECMVLQANGRKKLNGKTLRTMSLRANVMYGEGDPYYVTSGLRSAMANGGRLVRVGSGTAKLQQVYAGNTAWAFVCADRALGLNSNLGGEVFYVPDDTPVQNSFLFMKPFLESRNCGLTPYRIPSSLVYYFLYITEIFLHMLSPLVKVSLPTASCSVRYISMDLYFDGSKARRLLGYRPLYTPGEAVARTLQYYRTESD